MKKIYNIIENYINYLVIESDNDNDDFAIYHNIINNFWYKIPKKYHNSKDIKFITNNGYHTKTFYTHNKIEHNIYGASFSVRNNSTGFYYNSYRIYGEKYDNMTEWSKKRTIILRAKKIQKLNNL